MLSNYENCKKEPPRSCNFEAASSRACAWNFPRKYYTKFPEKCKPQSGRGRRFSPVSWEFALTIIGDAWLVGRLFRLVDWIER